VRKNKDGEQIEETQWHRVTFFGKLGEIAGEYLRKGSQCYVEGSIRYDKYTDKEGVEKYSTDIIADEMQMLGGKPVAESGERRERPQREPAPHQAPPADDFADDDIPF
jgi:single-strand DNA-binding protein